MIDALLRDVVHLYASTHISEPCAGAVLVAALHALQLTGGRVVLFQSALCSTGPGALQNRNEKHMGTDKEVALFEVQDYFWRKTAQECSLHGIAVDLYVHLHCIDCIANLLLLLLVVLTAIVYAADYDCCY